MKEYKSAVKTEKIELWMILPMNFQKNVYVSEKKEKNKFQLIFNRVRKASRLSRKERAYLLELPRQRL